MTIQDIKWREKEERQQREEELEILKKIKLPEDYYFEAGAPESYFFYPKIFKECKFLKIFPSSKKVGHVSFWGREIIFYLTEQYYHELKEYLEKSEINIKVVIEDD